MTLACSVFGHKPTFRADGSTMSWQCARGCGDGGSKTYPTGDEAQRYATAFNEPESAMGRRAPLIGLLPVRLWRLWKDSRRR